MGLPTLLRKGSLRPGMGESQEFLDSIRPIDYIIDWFSKKDQSPKSMSDRFVVALSTTGTGKSTTLPTELYLRLFRDKNILVTQPRIVTAIDIPRSIVSVPVYSDMKMGENIGYQTGDYVRKPLKRGILFTTVGVLLQQIKTMHSEDFARKYKIIILDEAHERSTDMDLVFFYIKKLSKKIPLASMPFVVCASGTMNVNLYKEYFDTSTLFIIQGDSYPIQNYYLKYDSDNLMREIVDTIKKINDNVGDRHKEDIVLFVPTNSMINKIRKTIEAEETLAGVLSIGVDSNSMKQVSSSYNNVFDNIDTLKGVSRKLIMGTNSIETGITLESISYCIDTGLVTVVEYNPVYRANVLMSRPVTKAMAMQRRGRVGRIQEGNFFPLYSEETFGHMQDIQYPALLTTELTKDLLTMICLTPGINFRDLDMMTKIPSISLSNALYKLSTLGLIRHLQATDLGTLVNQFRQLSIENTLLLVSNPGDIEILNLVTWLALGKQNIEGKGFKLSLISSEIRTVINCEIIEVLYAIEAILEKAFNESSEAASKFCGKLGFRADFVNVFIEKRNELMLDCFNITGFKFSKKNQSILELSRLPSLSELNSRVIDIKELMFEAYKLNLAVGIEDGVAKSIHTGLHFFCKITKDQYAIYDQILFRKNKHSEEISPSVVNGISVLSGAGFDIPELFR